MTLNGNLVRYYEDDTMATLKGMAVRPLHMSYRAIGSSSGIKEFKAGNSHFGSAEIPLTDDDKIERELRHLNKNTIFLL